MPKVLAKTVYDRITKDFQAVMYDHHSTPVGFDAAKLAVDTKHFIARLRALDLPIPQTNLITNQPVGTISMQLFLDSKTYAGLDEFFVEEI